MLEISRTLFRLSVGDSVVAESLPQWQAHILGGRGSRSHRRPGGSGGKPPGRRLCGNRLGANRNSTEWSRLSWTRGSAFVQALRASRPAACGDREGFVDSLEDKNRCFGGDADADAKNLSEGECVDRAVGRDMKFVFCDAISV